jgi:hypothetical protein
MIYALDAVAPGVVVQEGSGLLAEQLVVRCRFQLNDQRNAAVDGFQYILKERRCFG